MEFEKEKYLTSKTKSNIFQCLVIPNLPLVIIFETYIKKLIAKLCSFTLRSEITDMQEEMKNFA